MASFEFATAARILFGSGKLNELGSLIAAGGKRLLLVCGRSSAAAPRVKEILSSLDGSVSEFQVHGEPTLELIRAGIEAARGCDLVIGLGGGSAIDLAKGIAVAATHPGPIWDSGDAVLPLYLAAGVTSIRSTGDEIVAATLVARFAAVHPESAPRVFTCTPLLDAEPPIHRDVGQGLTDPGAVPALLDDLQRWHIRTVKIYAGTGRDVGRTIIDEGHRRGLFVTAHLGRYAAQDAVADGVDGLEHIQSVFNYIIPPDAAKQPGHRGRVDLHNPLCTALVTELARR